MFLSAFDFLLETLDDLTLDVPDSPTLIGNFIARTVADDCIPPKYVQSKKIEDLSPLCALAIKRANTLLSMKHGMVRLDNVWGTGGGIRPVKYLTKKIVLLLEEYLSSKDIQEALQCLQELEVPHFHHELVYQVRVITLLVVIYLFEIWISA